MLDKILKITGIVLTVVLVLALGVNLGYNTIADSYLNKLTRNETVNEDEIEVYDLKEYVHIDADNIVLLGIDSEDGTSRSDAIKLITLDKTNYDITITSIQRDTCLFQPMQNRYEKINHAYWYNRVEGALSALNYSLDLDIKKYVLINFNSLEQVVDLIGGVDIYLTDTEARYASMMLGGEGTYHLNGYYTLQYCRIRETDDDYHRMERQNTAIQAVITALKGKSVPELLTIVGQLMPFIDTNLTNSEIKSYAMDMLKYDLNNINQFSFPINGAEDIAGSITVNGYGPNTLLKDYEGQVKQMHMNIYGEDGYEPSEHVVKIDKDTKKLAGLE